MKYKPCCNTVCLVLGCETREQGGCYCLCRLKDYESSLVNILEGRSYRQGEGVIYVPNRQPIPLQGEEKEKTESQLAKVREKIKEYEI